MRTIAKALAALALMAALAGCAHNPWNAAQCVFDSRCNPYPDTPHNPVKEWTSDQPAL